MRTTMADRDNAGDAEQQRPAIFCKVDLGHHFAHDLFGLATVDADLVHQRRRPWRSRYSAHAFADLQQHVAGEAVRDDDVAVTREDLDALDVAVEVDRQLLHQRARLAHQRVALQLLAADVEDADARLGDAEGAAGSRPSPSARTAPGGAAWAAGWRRRPAPGTGASRRG